MSFVAFNVLSIFVELWKIIGATMSIILLVNLCRKIDSCFGFVVLCSLFSQFVTAVRKWVKGSSVVVYEWRVHVTGLFTSAANR